MNHNNDADHRTSIANRLIERTTHYQQRSGELSRIEGETTRRVMLHPETEELITVPPTRADIDAEVIAALMADGMSKHDAEVAVLLERRAQQAGELIEKRLVERYTMWPETDAEVAVSAHRAGVRAADRIRTSERMHDRIEQEVSDRHRKAVEAPTTIPAPTSPAPLATATTPSATAGVTLRAQTSIRRRVVRFSRHTRSMEIENYSAATGQVWHDCSGELAFRISDMLEGWRAFPVGGVQEVVGAYGSGTTCPAGCPGNGKNGQPAQWHSFIRIPCRVGVDRNWHNLEYTDAETDAAVQAAIAQAKAQDPHCVGVVLSLTGAVDLASGGVAPAFAGRPL
ncbi:hypothetical protein GWK16_17975 [Roseomonas sp. JC162]|uniref:Uncharacterized protein n=1 Tax=Neoroseomonas marina TaxID=1232220 RepID=A0A848EFA3_9PROT|nr:hypothetical protein [Neoroseomonas marina]NMJ43141.1 hypothetical protein [Neoroseomonas marina]